MSRKIADKIRRNRVVFRGCGWLWNGSTSMSCRALQTSTSATTWSSLRVNQSGKVPHVDMNEEWRVRVHRKNITLHIASYFWCQMNFVWIKWMANYPLWASYLHMWWCCCCFYSNVMFNYSSHSSSVLDFLSCSYQHVSEFSSHNGLRKWSSVPQWHRRHRYHLAELDLGSLTRGSLESLNFT